MKNGSFGLVLLAALCAEAIPLALRLTLAAALAMALPQILDRLGIWAKKRAAPGAGTPRAAKWKTQCRSLSIPILRDLKEKCKYEKYDA